MVPHPWGSGQPEQLPKGKLNVLPQAIGQHSTCPKADLCTLQIYIMCLMEKQARDGR